MQDKGIITRPLRLGDVLGTSRMYLSLSDDNRRLFHPFPFQQWTVVLILVLMFISQKTPNFIRRLVPKVVFLSLVANDATAGTPAGFGYLRLAKRLTDNKYAAALGLMVSDSYQQQGLGTQLMRSLIKLASQNDVSLLSVLVLRNNQKAIKLYQKCGFNMVREKVIQERGIVGAIREGAKPAQWGQADRGDISVIVRLVGG